MSSTRHARTPQGSRLRLTRSCSTCSTCTCMCMTPARRAACPAARPLAELVGPGRPTPASFWATR
eukprot:14707351-Alexandrium_andersonii.AAC.1